MELVKHLQEVIAPQVFTPRAVYDGRKNLFSIRELPFDQGSKTVHFMARLDYKCFDTYFWFQFEVTLGSRTKPTKVTLTRVATINPE